MEKLGRLPVELEGIEERELVQSMLLWGWIESDAIEEAKADAERESFMRSGGID